VKATSVEIHSGAVCQADIEAVELWTRKRASINGKLVISGSQ